MGARPRGQVGQPRHATGRVQTATRSIFRLAGAAQKVAPSYEAQRLGQSRFQFDRARFSQQGALFPRHLRRSDLGLWRNFEKMLAFNSTWLAVFISGKTSL